MPRQCRHVLQQVLSVCRVVPTMCAYTMGRGCAQPWPQATRTTKCQQLRTHLGEEVGIDRSDLAGLEHHGAANDHGRADLGSDLVEGVVPGCDAAYHPDGLLDHQRAHRRALLPLDAVDQLERGAEVQVHHVGLHTRRLHAPPQAHYF